MPRQPPIDVQLSQGYSGEFGDYIALLVLSVGGVAVLLRAVLHIYPEWLKSLAPLVSADYSLGCAFALCSNTTPFAGHPYLTMHLFLISSFLRFSGTWDREPPLAQQQTPPQLHQQGNPFAAVGWRFALRGMELLLLLQGLPGYKCLASPRYMVPLVVLLSTARSNEVFRAWRPSEKGQLRQKKSLSEEDQMKKALSILPRPRAAVAADDQMPTVTEISTRRGRDVRKCGGRWIANKSVFQMGFLWLDGSGPLVACSLAVHLQAIIDIIALHRTSHNSDTLLVIFVAVIFCIFLLYLCLQCLPALASSLISLAAFLQQPNYHAVFLSLQAWTSDMRLFCWTCITASPSFPRRCVRLRPRLLSLFCGFVEGAELFIHVIIAILARLLLQGLFLCVISIVAAYLWLLRRIPLPARLQNYINSLMSRDYCPAASKLLNGLWKLVAKICAEELSLMDSLFQVRGSFIITNVSFVEMDRYSNNPPYRTTKINGQQNAQNGSMPASNALTINESIEREIMRGYTWIERPEETIVGPTQEEVIGHAYLKATLLEVPSNNMSDGNNMEGAVGGWITMEGDCTQARYYEWGDSSIPNISPRDDPGGQGHVMIREVGHFFGGVSNYRSLFDANQIMANPSRLRVWMKFGCNPARISHIWVNGLPVIHPCGCDPHSYSNVYDLALNVTAFPDPVDFQLDLVLM